MALLEKHWDRIAHDEPHAARVVLQQLKLSCALRDALTV